jgi:glycosyltransferase involved in cell wall biosynthesis
VGAGAGLRTLVTVGVPFRDAERWLGDAVRSVFAQTHATWELLLIDDGSSDASLAIARSIVDPRVTLTSDGSHRGLPNRLNEIARAARGEYLARMDADDLMHPERIQKQLRFLECNPRVDVVGSACISLGGSDEPRGSRGGFLPEPYTRASILSGAQIMHGTLMAKSSWFRSHPYDPAFTRAQDMRLLLENVSSTKFAVLSEPLYFYRDNASLSFKNYLSSYRSTDRLIREYGFNDLGVLGTIRLRVKNAMKMGAVAVLVATGRQEWVTLRRNTPLSDAAAIEAQRTLDHIRGVAVPGLTQRTPA